jgi:hypothetical protein
MNISIYVHQVKLHPSRIEREQSIRKQPFLEAGEILNRFDCLNRTHGPGHGTKYPGLLAGQNFFGWRRLAKETSVAGAFSRYDGHGLSLEANNAGV